MKLLTLSVVTFCWLQGVAQQTKSPFFCEVVPLFTNSYKDLSYDMQLQNDRSIYAENAYVSSRDPLKQSYYQYGLIVKAYAVISDKLRFSAEAGFANSRYNGSMTYTLQSFDPNGYARTVTDKEQISSEWLSYKVGISRWFNLDKSGRLMFATDFLSGVETEAQSEEIEIDTYTMNGEVPERSNDRISVGAQLDLKLNYRFTRHIGLGVTLPQVVGLYWNDYFEDTWYNRRNWQQTEFTIGKLRLPRLSLVCFIGKTQKQQAPSE